MNAPATTPAITGEEIGRLERLEKQATTAPWRIEGQNYAYAISHWNPTTRNKIIIVAAEHEANKPSFPDYPHEFPMRGISGRNSYSDAAFIAAIRNAAPALLVEARSAATLHDQLAAKDAEIAGRDERIKALEEALAPFAPRLKSYTLTRTDDDMVGMTVAVKHYRRAAIALAGRKEGEDVG